MPVFEFNQRVENGEINGLRYVAKNIQPYGFWTINVEGQSRTPSKLEGVFVTLDDAIQAFSSYSFEKKENEKVEEEKPIRIRKINAAKLPKEERYVEVELTEPEEE